VLGGAAPAYLCSRTSCRRRAARGSIRRRTRRRRRCPGLRTSRPCSCVVCSPESVARLARMLQRPETCPGQCHNKPAHRIASHAQTLQCRGGLAPRPLCIPRYHSAGHAPVWQLTAVSENPYAHAVHAPASHCSQFACVVGSVHPFPADNQASQFLGCGNDAARLRRGRQ
jgi:hypothetical protein